MHTNRPVRRVHSAEFKTQVLSECRQPGASVAAVAMAHGLNPNVVHKWLAGHGLERAGLAPLAPAAARPPVLQFVPVELASADTPEATVEESRLPDVRIEFDCGSLQVRLRCPATAGPSHAAPLRAMADAIGSA